MAQNGGVGVAVTAYDSLWFNWWVISQDAVANSSTIGWNLVLTSSSAGKIVSSPTRNWAVNINGGDDIAGKNNVSIDNNSEKILASGTKVIEHNADGTKTFYYYFTQQFDITFSGKYIGAVKGDGYGEIDAIPRKAYIVAAPDFTDETESITISIKNPLGYAAEDLQACIADGWNVLVGYKPIENKNATSFTFWLTEAERKVLRANCNGANDKKLNFFVYTKINGTDNYSIAERTFYVVNADPVIAPTVIDVGVTSTALTGNPNTMIKYFNDMQCTINATAKKEATISKSYIKNGTNFVEASTHKYTYTDNNYFKFTTIDSRGNTVSKEITVPMIEYIPLTCNIEADIKLDSSNSTKAIIDLTVKGNYFNGSFGKVTNSLTLSYTLTDGNGNKTTNNLTIPTGNIKNGSYEVSHTINNLDYKESYTVSVTAADAIYKEVIANSKTLKAVPVFDWSNEDFNFNVPIMVNNEPIGLAVEQDNSSTWKYRKWDNGDIEIWCTTSGNSYNMNSVYGNLYYTSGNLGLPSNLLKEINCVNITPLSSGGLMGVSVTGVTTTNLSYFIWAGTNAAATFSGVKLMINIRGKWK